MLGAAPAAGAMGRGTCLSRVRGVGQWPDHHHDGPRRRAPRSFPTSSRVRVPLAGDLRGLEGPLPLDVVGLPFPPTRCSVTSHVRFRKRVPGKTGLEARTARGARPPRPCAGCPGLRAGAGRDDGPRACRRRDRGCLRGTPDVSNRESSQPPRRRPEATPHAASFRGSPRPPPTVASTGRARRGGYSPSPGGRAGDTHPQDTQDRRATTHVRSRARAVRSPGSDSTKRATPISAVITRRFAPDMFRVRKVTSSSDGTTSSA